MTDIRNDEDKCRKEFESSQSWTSGDYSTFKDGAYKYDLLQRDWTLFRRGYQAGRAHDVDGLIAEIEKAKFNNPCTTSNTMHDFALDKAISIIRKHFGKE